jgi:hypothetical protein
MLGSWAAIFSQPVEQKSKPFCCLACKKDFKNPGGLASHFIARPEHDRKKKSVFRAHQCDQCKLCFKTQPELAVHVVKHTSMVSVSSTSSSSGPDIVATFGTAPVVNVGLLSTTTTTTTAMIQLFCLFIHPFLARWWI